MARRPGGKTERRKARQRRAQRPASPASAATPRPDVTAEPVETASPEPAKRITAPSAASAYTAASSSLTDRERAEYHYVERDLRSIGILTAVLVALLLASYVVFNALGLVA